MPTEIQIVNLLASQTTAVRRLLDAAFGAEPVADLVDLLRTAPGHRQELELVALEAGADPATGALAGYAALVPVTLLGEDGDRRETLCLCPLAVHPDRQGQGIGRRLVEAALRLAEQLGEPFVTLEGNPALYHRFGFVAGTDVGLIAPSPTIPAGAHQVRTLTGYRGQVRGRICYPAQLWAAGGAGLPEPADDRGPSGIPLLFEFARYAGWLEAVTAGADLDTPVPTCPGWTVADLLAHVAEVHRRVTRWIETGRRPAGPGPAPDPALHTRYADGWRHLYGVLAAAPFAAPVATWSPWDATIGFWRRRMAHEVAVHTIDAVLALGAAPRWTMTDDLAIDGIDEVLRLFLSARLGMLADGRGGMVRVEAGDRHWEVGLNRSVAVHSLPHRPPVDAVVCGDPVAVYTWLWQRPGAAAGPVATSGDPAVLADLRRCLTLAAA